MLLEEFRNRFDPRPASTQRVNILHPIVVVLGQLVLVYQLQGQRERGIDLIVREPVETYRISDLRRKGWVEENFSFGVKFEDRPLDLDQPFLIIRQCID